MTLKHAFCHCENPDLSARRSNLEFFRGSRLNNAVNIEGFAMESTKNTFSDKVKDFLRKTTGKMKLPRIGAGDDFEPDVSENGLLTDKTDTPTTPEEVLAPMKDQPAKNVIVQPASARNEQLEQLQKGFTQLITQLQTVNTNLNKQVDHQEQLIDRLDKLPQIVEGFTPALDNQRQLIDELMNDLKASAKKNLQFVEAVESIPTETAKQTDALTSIDHQLAAAAASDAQMAQSFNKFRASIEKLDESTASQTDSIIQMSKTFAASDRYLKYIISRDKKRMFWLFITSISICTVVILILTAIIIFIAR